MVNERRRVSISEDGQFPGFCLPIHQRGQTLYHSKNLSSFSYPSDGILVQFKLSLCLLLLYYFFLGFTKYDGFFQNRGSHGLPRFGGSITGAAAQHVPGRLESSKSIGGWRVCARHLSQHEQLCWRVRQSGQGRVKLGPNQISHLRL